MLKGTPTLKSKPFKWENKALCSYQWTVESKLKPCNTIAYLKGRTNDGFGLKMENKTSLVAR